MKDLATANFDKMTAAEFEEYLPELFAMGGGKISEEPALCHVLQGQSVLRRAGQRPGDHRRAGQEPV